MTKEEFKDLIEAHINCLVEKPEIYATRTYEGAKKIFFKSSNTLSLYPNSSNFFLSSGVFFLIKQDCVNIINKYLDQ